MNEKDLTVFEYRRQKDLLFSSIAREERLRDDYIRSSIYTSSCGWVDYAIYYPSQRAKEALPTVFVFHGGGFVLGFYEQEGRYCRWLADRTGCAIVNVDYALAPEFKFPLPLHSSYEALLGIMEKAQRLGLDDRRVVVMGHSSGGSIAADLCLINRDQKRLNIVGEILDYAPLDQKLDQAQRVTSDTRGSVSESRALQYIHWYFDDESDLDHPLASPARCADLRSLPPTLVIEAELDSLRHEEAMFVERARTAGVDVTEKLYEDCGHGFTHSVFASGYAPEQAKDAWNLMAAFICNVTAKA